jgi:tRNA(Ile)-lysidine synthase
MSSGFTVSHLAASLEKLIPDLQAARFCVAFSGGVDSTALLHAMAGVRARVPGLMLRAAHVNHHLQPQADDWAGHCDDVAAGLGVPCAILEVSVSPASRESPEAAARAARYAGLAAALSDEEYLLTAHHRDDQLETVLLQLLRGAGVAGLSGMPAITALGRGYLLRPLLDFGRAELVAYATAAGLRWIEDLSNADTRFDRNFLRRQLLPVLRKRWPAAAESVSRSAGHLAEAQALLSERAREDLALGRAGTNLRVAVARGLEPARARNLLRFWIAAAGFRAPSSALLEQIVKQMLHARPDAVPVIEWGGAELRRFRDELYLGPPAPRAPKAEFTWDWRSHPELVLPETIGWLRAREALAGELALRIPSQPLRVSFGSGARRLRLQPGAPRRTLRNLFQEHGVVPWMRACLPLVFIGESLAAVADLWVDAEFQSDESGGLVIEWLGHPPVF